MKWQVKKNPYWKKRLSPEELRRALLWNRGVRERKEVRRFLQPLPPQKITLSEAGIEEKEMVKAKERIKLALSRKEKVLVYGDYDVDGLCSTALVWENLYLAGVMALPYIPDRLKDGYGLNVAAVARVKKKIPQLSLVITVDNGIIAHQAIRELKKMGVETIIVDHHLKSGRRPPAVAVVHTTRLAGSGVAWFLVRELASLGVAPPDLGLAALGTVADLLPVLGVNRSLIKHGIPYLQSTRRVGLRHLFQQAGIAGRPLDSYKISFIIAPRLNALGRIANPLDGLRLLCSRRLEKGESLARLAQQINAERQKMTEVSTQKARRIVLRQSKLPPLIFISDSSYHRGIIGLIAGKLTEEFHRPSVVIKEEKGVSHGSARSIKGFNIFALLKEAREMMIELGGHPLAAGFKVEREKIPQLAKKLTRLAKKRLRTEMLEPKIEIDGRLSLQEISLPYYQALSQLAPFGLGNPVPTFLLEGVRLVEKRRLGSNGDHLKLVLDDPATPITERVMAEAIGFRLGPWEEKLLKGDLLDIVANLEEDNWGGRRKIILKIKDLRLRKKVVE